MSGFKDAVAADIKGVFINSDEFADVHDIDGASITCVIDTDLIHERSTMVSESLFGLQCVLHVSTLDIDEPVRGQIMRLDGQLYIVQEIAENMGMYDITLEAAEQ